MAVKRLLVLINRHASGGTMPVAEALATLERAGLDVEVRAPDDVEHLRFIIRAEAPSADAVVVAGGNGTINAALAPILEVGVPLGILPMGRANDLARTLGIPTDLVAACGIITASARRTIDVGWADTRPFVNAAGIGGEDATERYPEDGLAATGRLGASLAMLGALRRRRVFRAEIFGQAGARRVSSTQITVGNGVLQRGGASWPDSTAIDDGRLGLYSVPPQSMLQLLRLARVITGGRPERLRQRVDISDGRSFRIATQPPMTVSLDGEPLLRTPVNFRVSPGALQVFAPPPGRGAPRSRAGSRYARTGTTPAAGFGSLTREEFK